MAKRQRLARSGGPGTPVRRRIPAWRAVAAISLLLAAAGAAALIGEETDAASDTVDMTVLAPAEETVLISVEQVEATRPARRAQVRAQYADYLRRRAGEEPPPEPVADIAEVFETLPSEILEQAPAEEVLE